MAETTEIKKGVVIRHKENLFVVTDFKFVNPGKGCAFTKTKMKNLGNGRSIEITYKSGESIDIVEVHKQTMQYLYMNDGMFSFMNKETYETIEVEESIIGEDAKYLKEGLDVITSIHEGSVVAIQLPTKIRYTVKQAPPAVKGDTASGNVTKDAYMDNDLMVKVPIFIKEGEEILVNPEKGEYSGRAGE